jgi:hypothetical protein
MKRIGKVEEKDSNLGLIAAGITGAIIGAGVAVVASVAMKDERTKKHIQDISMSFYEQIKEYVRKSNFTTPNSRKKILKKLGTGLT